MIAAEGWVQSNSALNELKRSKGTRPPRGIYRVKDPRQAGADDFAIARVWGKSAITAI